jgi:hypothetical protein
VEEEERVPHGDRAPFIAGRGGGRRAAVTLWARQVSGGCGLEWSTQSVVRTRRLTGGPSGFDIFLELSKSAQTWKLKLDALRCSKNCQILHATRLGHCEQRFQLFRHLNLNICRAKIFGIDSQFEYLVNF